MSRWKKGSSGLSRNSKNMASTKEIRRRIKSVKSTRQITKAMELVAAAKMRKAQMQTLATRAYARYAWELVQRLTDITNPSMHRLLKPASGTGRALIILMTSNRGLIGGFNHNIIETAAQYARKSGEADFISLGRKGRDNLRKMGFNIVADFEKKDTATSILDVQSL